MSRASEQLSMLAREFRQNQRLRWGVYLAGMLVAIYLILVLDDYQNSLIAEYHRKAMTRSELASIAPEEVWRDRIGRESGELDIREASVWRAPTPALGRANLQSTITEFAELSGLDGFSLKVGSFQPLEGLDGVSTVRMELEAAYVDDRVLDFLGRLEANSPRFRIERLRLRKGTRNNRMQMVILAYFTTTASVRT